MLTVDIPNARYFTVCGILGFLLYIETWQSNLFEARSFQCFKADFFYCRLVQSGSYTYSSSIYCKVSTHNIETKRNFDSFKFLFVFKYVCLVFCLFDSFFFYYFLFSFSYDVFLSSSDFP